MKEAASHELRATSNQCCGLLIPHGTKLKGAEMRSFAVQEFEGAGGASDERPSFGWLEAHSSKLAAQWVRK